MFNFKNSDFCKLLRLCAISALQISKKHFAMFDIFVRMKLVLTVWVSTSLSKFGYSQSPLLTRALDDLAFLPHLEFYSVILNS